MVLILLFSFARCYAQDIILDGNFSDWVDKPSIESTDELSATPLASPTPVPTAEPEEMSATSPQQAMAEDSNGPKYKISQLKWILSENSDVLYLMIRISHGKYAQDTKITTEMVTDYGNYNIITNYDTSDSSVFTTIGDTNITSNEGKCSVINSQTVYLEYAIPIGELIQDMKWGYMIKIKVRTEDDAEPKKDYIIISTASTGSTVGVVIVIAFAGVGYYLIRRKKIL